MDDYRSSISHDNIYNLSEISANFFNKYTDPHIKDWCQRNHIIANNSANILNPKNPDYQRFIDAVTRKSIDPAQIVLTTNIRTYQQIFPNNLSFVKFMKFVLGVTYLLDPSKRLKLTRLEDIYPFIGITYFMYNKIDHSTLLNANPDNRALILQVLQDIRNLWTMFFYRKTNSHSNL
jgi:hypothetical protein